MLLSQLYVEFIGTFIFICVILKMGSYQWGGIAIGLTLAAMILFGGSISGGHFNPAVTFAQYMQPGSMLSWWRAGGYILMQVIAGVLAVLFLRYLNNVSSRTNAL